MKIVAGQYGGRRLSVPKGRDVRPTSDKVRAAVFNMLESRRAVADAHVLDAFCGTGALGLEAISRGAKSCHFVDKARESLQCARDNAQMLGVEDVVQFRMKDVLKIGVRPTEDAPYDLIFLDPPYNKGFIADMLNGLKEGGWCAPGCWIICETEKQFSLPENFGFYLDAEKLYGNIKVTLLRVTQ